MKTIDRIKEFLADESNFMFKSRTTLYHRNEIDYIGVRNGFVTANGIKVSIQQSALHYCASEEQVEMWNCYHHEMLTPYGDGDNPYEYVPLKIVASYIDELEKLDAADVERINKFQNGEQYAIKDLS